MKIRVTKQFDFEMAHALWRYDGKCKYTHGHSYRLFVTVTGTPVTNTDSPKNGMVIDFGELKSIVKENIVKKFDHATLFNAKAPTDNLKNVPEMFDKLITVNFQPTCENLVACFAEIIKKKLPDRVELFSLKLHETATSYTEWFASDNT